MGSNGRFTDQQVVNSFNLFIDGDRSSVIGDTSSRGDDVKINLEGSSIIANDGEMIKMTLTNFEMFNNLYHVDENNSRFTTRCSQNTTTPTPIARDLTRQNYSNIGDIAINFANIIGNAINDITTTTHKVLLLDIKNVVEPGFLPYDTLTQLNHTAVGASEGVAATDYTVGTTKIKPTSLELGNTGNRLLDITFQIIDGSSTSATFGKPHAHLIQRLNIQCLSSQGDAYCILGGLRQDDTADNTFNSFKVDLSAPYPFTASANGNFVDTTNDNTRIRVRSYFPMQRMTDPYVYLRCKSQQSGGLEMTVLADSLLANNSSDITSSDILAKLKRDVEFISYDNSAGNEYFVNLQQKKLSSLQLYLTDSKNRPLGRSRIDGSGYNTGGGTAAGYDSIDEGVLLKNRTNITGLGYYNSSGKVSQLQSSLGNLFFTAVLRVDIIKMSNPARLETPALPLPLPARKAQNGVLTFQDYGMPKYGV
jgi:hypothetical protein